MAQVTPCKKCNNSIVFLRTKNGKFNPVDYKSLSEEDKFNIAHQIPVNFDFTRHKSHFATCPAAASFRKSKTDKPPVPYKED